MVKTWQMLGISPAVQTTQEVFQATAVRLAEFLIQLKFLPFVFVKLLHRLIGHEVIPAKSCSMRFMVKEATVQQNVFHWSIAVRNF